MEYTTLGKSGLKISRIGLGCMSVGTKQWREWVIEGDEARALLERAIDLGINFFDTANSYSYGESERILGRVLGEYDRDWPVIATKVHRPVDPDNPNAQGLSRKAIEQELANSLERLDVETIDLYQIHRWDYDTPIVETLRTLADAVRRGHVRYLGVSAMWAYQLATALHCARERGLERFISMQNHYNLAYREEEREMLPFCRQEGVGVIPFSPLGRGYLARPHETVYETARGAYIDGNDRFSRRIDVYHANGGATINERVAELAAQHGVTMGQIAIAWLLNQPGVDAPIIGTTSVEHLEQAVEAIEIDLSDADLDYLEEPYEPVPVVGHH